MSVLPGAHDYMLLNTVTKSQAVVLVLRGLLNTNHGVQLYFCFGGLEFAQCVQIANLCVHDAHKNCSIPNGGFTHCQQLCVAAAHVKHPHISCCVRCM